MHPRTLEPLVLHSHTFLVKFNCLMTGTKALREFLFWHRIILIPHIIKALYLTTILEMRQKVISHKNTKFKADLCLH